MSADPHTHQLWQRWIESRSFQGRDDARLKYLRKEGGGFKQFRYRSSRCLPIQVSWFRKVTGTKRVLEFLRFVFATLKTSSMLAEGIYSEWLSTCMKAVHTHRSCQITLIITIGQELRGYKYGVSSTQSGTNGILSRATHWPHIGLYLAISPPSDHHHSFIYTPIYTILSPQPLQALTDPHFIPRKLPLSSAHQIQNYVNLIRDSRSRYKWFRYVFVTWLYTTLDFKTL